MKKFRQKKHQRVPMQKIINAQNIIKEKGYELGNFLPDTQQTRNIVAFAEDQSRIKYAIKFSYDKNAITREFLKMKEFSHTNIMSPKCLLDIEDFFGLVMPIAEGGDLLEVYSNLRNKISRIQIQHIMYSLLSALDCIHRAGYIHRDVKLDNILLTGKKIESILLLSDFESITPSNNPEEFYGTDNFKAPEIIRKEKCMRFLI